MRIQVASIAAGTGTENRRRRRSMDQTGHNEGHANGSGAAPRRSRTRTDTRRTHAPTHAPGTPYPSHRSRPRRTTPHPLQGAPGPPTRIFPDPPAPRARRRLRSVAAGFPRERHFPRAVHRLKISVLALFSYRVNKMAINI